MKHLQEVELINFLCRQKKFLSVEEILQATQKEKIILGENYLRRFLKSVSQNQNYITETESRKHKFKHATYYKIKRKKLIAV